LIGANSGLRSGEQRQLKWSDVELGNTLDIDEDSNPTI